MMKTGRVLCLLVGILATSTCSIDDPAPDHVATIAQELTFDIDIGSTLGSQALQGTTLGAGNNFSSDCNSNGSEDVAVLFHAPQDGIYTFSLAGSNYDTVIQILNSDQTASLGCNDDANNTSQSSIERTLTRGQVVTIVIEGFGGSRGNFKLGIGLTSIPTILTSSLQL